MYFLASFEKLLRETKESLKKKNTFLTEIQFQGICVKNRFYECLWSGTTLYYLPEPLVLTYHLPISQIFL